MALRRALVWLLTVWGVLLLCLSFLDWIYYGRFVLLFAYL